MRWHNCIRRNWWDGNFLLTWLLKISKLEFFVCMHMCLFKIPNFLLVYQAIWNLIILLCLSNVRSKISYSYIVMPILVFSKVEQKFRFLFTCKSTIYVQILIRTQMSRNLKKVQYTSIVPNLNIIFYYLLRKFTRAPPNYVPSWVRYPKEMDYC